MATTATPVYQQLRAMRGRGQRRSPLSLRVGEVIRCDGVKYRVQAPPVQAETGSVLVEVYNEDNQYDTLYLSPASVNVKVIGTL